MEEVSNRMIMVDTFRYSGAGVEGNFCNLEKYFNEIN